MIKKILFVFGVFFLVGCAAKKVELSKVDYIRKNFAWGDKEYLVVNFVQPEKKCHYNQYSENNINIYWPKGLKAFCKSVDGENIYHIKVYSDFYKVLNLIDSKKSFVDKNNFFYNNFFNNYSSCYALLVLRKDGNYKTHIGEYSKEYVFKFIEELDKMPY